MKEEYVLKQSIQRQDKGWWKDRILTLSNAQPVNMPFDAFRLLDMGLFNSLSSTIYLCIPFFGMPLKYIDYPLYVSNYRYNVRFRPIGIFDI